MIQKFKEFLNHNNGFLGATYNFLKLKKYQLRNYKTHNYRFENNNKQINQIVKDLNKNGYHVIKNFISENDCKELIKIINDFIQNRKELIWVDEEGSDERILGAENISEKLNSLNLNDFTKKIGSFFLQQKLELLMIMANKVNFKPNNKGSGGGWHRDSNAGQFKSLLYLSNVEKENGPLQIIKNSNNNFLNFKIFIKLNKKFPTYRFSNDEINKIVKRRDIVEITGGAGTLILFNTSMLHRGSPIKEGMRYAITNYFYPVKKISENEIKFEKRITKKIF
ncbi:MAG: hypothetical protein CMC40_06045 [Flavobacteriaceae bacterium]|nr:hypothetical protein [Flavobacteriaceae bacterium]